MKITFLGTSHGYDEPGRFCSSAVISTGDKHYIIDAGAPVMGLLRTYGFEYKDINHIFITHAHPDHYLGLVELTSKIERFGEFSGVRMTVHIPKEFPYEPLLNYLFGSGRLPLLRDTDGRLRTKKDRIAYVEYPDAEAVVFEDENIKITAIPNCHTAHSHSFLAECEGKRVFFSGDFAKGFTDYPEFLRLPGTDVLNLAIIEGAHARLNDPEIMELLGETRTQKIIFNHVHCGRNTPEIIDEFRNYVRDRFPVEESYDGMVIKL